MFKVCNRADIEYEICWKYFREVCLCRTKCIFIFPFIIALFVRVFKDVWCEQLQQESLKLITPKAQTGTVTYLVAPECVIQIRFAYYETAQLSPG